MKIKDIILSIIVIVFMLLNVKGETDIEKYEKLEIKDGPSIRYEDLPEEFSIKAFKVVDEFIRKTLECEKEVVIYFDYITGEVINCAFGMLDNVEVDIFDRDIKGKHVASIHNHPRNVFSPPSGKNFNVLKREYEDYELVASRDGFWILEAKGLHKNLVNEMNIASNVFFNSALEYCTNRYNDERIIDKMCDLRYGNELSNYINNKKINHFKLNKKEYKMTNKSKKTVAEFEAFKRITDPEVIRIARERERDSTILSGKDFVYAFYQMMGMDVDYDAIFAD